MDIIPCQLEFNWDLHLKYRICTTQFDYYQHHPEAFILSKQSSGYMEKINVSFKCAFVFPIIKVDSGTRRIWLSHQKLIVGHPQLDP